MYSSTASDTPYHSAARHVLSLSQRQKRHIETAAASITIA